MKMVKKGNVKVEKVEAPPRPVGEIFKPAKEVKPIEGLKILVWGYTNSGKSHFSLTAPEPIFIIDTENGIPPLLPKFTDKETYHLNAVAVDPVVKEIDFDRSVELLNDALRSVIAYIDENPDVRGTLVIDSISDVWDWLGLWLVEDDSIEKTRIGEPKQLEWKHANRRYYKMILKLLFSNWNIVATAKVKEQRIGKDPDGNEIVKLVPKVQKNTDYWFDVIMRAEFNPLDKTRKFTIEKFRSLDVYTTFTNPTWDDVVKFIEEQLKTPIK